MNWDFGILTEKNPSVLCWLNWIKISPSFWWVKSPLANYMCNMDTWHVQVVFPQGNVGFYSPVLFFHLGILQSHTVKFPERDKDNPFCLPINSTFLVSFEVFLHCHSYFSVSKTSFSISNWAGRLWERLLIVYLNMFIVHFCLTWWCCLSSNQLWWVITWLVSQLSPIYLLWEQDTWFVL